MELTFLGESSVIAESNPPMKFFDIQKPRRLIAWLLCLVITVTSLWLFIGHFPIPLSFHHNVDATGVRIPVSRKGKMGYIDDRGRVVIPFIYNKGAPFDGDYAIIDDSFFIDRTGKCVSDIYAQVEPFQEEDGLAVIWFDSDRVGYINRSLEVVTKPSQSKIEHKNNWRGVIDLEGIATRDGVWDRGFGFKGGDITIVSKDGMFYLVNRVGEIVKKLDWDDISDLYGTRDLLVGSRNGKYGFIDFQGEQVSPHLWDSVHRSGLVKNSFIWVKKGEFWGMLDGEANIIVNPEWDKIERILRNRNNSFKVTGSKNATYSETSKWLDLCRVTSGSKLGIIDAEGKVIIEPSERWVSLDGKFDTAPLTFNAETKSGKRGVINTDGKFIIGCWASQDRITDKNRHWRIFSYDSNRLSDFYKEINRELKKRKFRTFTPPSTETVLIYDDTGRRIWQNRAYSLVIFTFSVIVLLVMVPFLLFWYMTYRRGTRSQKVGI